MKHVWLVSMGLAALAAACEAGSADAQAVSEVVVTGQRETRNAGQVSTTANAGILGDRNIFDTPFSQQSFTDTLIQDQQARTLDEVLDNATSIRTAGNSYSDADVFNIRGFPSSPFSVLFGGVPGLLGSRRPPVESAARVDVLLGPSALLYNAVGEQSVGGVVNIAPKRADAAPLNRLSASYVSAGSVELQGDVGRRFGPDGMFGVRVNLAGLDGDTPIDTQSQRLVFGSLGADVKAGRFSASLDVVTDSYRLLGRESGINPFPGLPVPRAPDATSNIFDTSSTYNEHNTLVLAKAAYQATSWLNLAAAYGHTHFPERYAGPFFAQIVDGAGDVSLSVVPLYSGSDADIGTLSAKAVFDTGAVHHELTASADIYDLKTGLAFSFGQQFLTNLYRPVALKPFVIKVAPVEDGPDDTHNRRESVALADVATLFGGRLTLIGGLREQRVNDRGVELIAGTATSHYDKDALTPAGAILFKVTPQLSVYGNYIQALQSGPTAPDGVANAGQVFSPYVAEQEEAGVKLDLGKTGATLAVFQIKEPSAYVDAATNRFTVNGEVRNRGVEVSGFGEVAPGVRLLSGASYFDARQTDAGSPTLDGKRAVGIPHWQANLGGELDVPGVRGLTLTGRAIYTSGEYVDAANTAAIPDWVRLDAGARFTFSAAGRPTTLRLEVRNLAGKNYWQDATQGVLYEGAPRTVRVSVATDF